MVDMTITKEKLIRKGYEENRIDKAFYLAANIQEIKLEYEATAEYCICPDWKGRRDFIACKHMLAHRIRNHQAEGIRVRVVDLNGDNTIIYRTARAAEFRRSLVIALGGEFQYV